LRKEKQKRYSSNPKRLDEYRPSKSVISFSPDFLSEIYNAARATTRHAFLCRPLAALRLCVNFLAFSAKILL